MMHSPHGKDWSGSGCHKSKQEKDTGTGKRGFHGHPQGKILGTTVVGERGQVVIPREARDEVGIESGDRFVVFGDKNKGSVVLVKADIFNHFAEVFMSKSKKLEKMAQEIWDATQAESHEGESDDPSEAGGSSESGDPSDTSKSDESSESSQSSGSGEPRKPSDGSTL